MSTKHSMLRQNSNMGWYRQILQPVWSTTRNV